MTTTIIQPPAPCETGEEIKSRVLAELTLLLPQIEEAARTNKPYADLAMRAANRLQRETPSWYLSMRDSAKDSAKPWITRGLDSAADLLRTLVTAEIKGETI